MIMTSASRKKNLWSNMRNSKPVVRDYSLVELLTWHQVCNAPIEPGVLGFLQLGISGGTLGPAGFACAAWFRAAVSLRVFPVGTEFGIQLLFGCGLRLFPLRS